MVSASDSAKGRLDRTLQAIDTANAADPTRVDYAFESHPKELLHGQRASHWLEVLEPEAGELLRVAVRAHHLRRWTLPRAEYPLGRPGYHAWRRALQDRHATEAGEIMRAAGYTEPEIERVGTLIRKRGLGRDAEVQVFEDVLCLVFIELQLESFAEKHATDKVVEIIARTLPKMSDRAIAVASKLPETAETARLLGLAVERAASRD